ncbi:hypothetical protein ACLOJK_034039 [Asimina triloba]
MVVAIKKAKIVDKSQVEQFINEIQSQADPTPEPEQSMAETEQSCDEMQEGKPVVDKDKISGGPGQVELNEQVPALAVDENNTPVVWQNTC